MKVIVFLDQISLGQSFTWTYGIVTLRIIEDFRSSEKGFSSRRAYLKWHFPIPSFLFCLIWNCSVTRACVFLSEGCIVRVETSDERTTAGGWGCTYYLGRCSFFVENFLWLQFSEFSRIYAHCPSQIVNNSPFPVLTYIFDIWYIWTIPKQNEKTQI